MNMCCLIMLHMDMLTLIENSLAKEQMSIQKVRMREVFVFSMCKQSCFYGVMSILCTVFDLLFTFLIL